MFSQDTPLHPVLESPQQPPNAWGRDPNICAEEQDGLYYFKVEATQCTSIRSLSPQYQQQSGKYLPSLLKDEGYFQPVIVHCCEEVTQVF